MSIFAKRLLIFTFIGLIFFFGYQTGANSKIKERLNNLERQVSDQAAVWNGKPVVMYGQNAGDCLAQHDAGDYDHVPVEAVLCVVPKPTEPSVYTGSDAMKRSWEALGLESVKVVADAGTALNGFRVAIELSCLIQAETVEEMAQCPNKLWGTIQYDLFWSINIPGEGMKPVFMTKPKECFTPERAAEIQSILGNGDPLPTQLEAIPCPEEI